MDTSIDEVCSDFRKALSEIDFSSYNPNSQQFDLTLRLGLMWYLLKEMDCNSEKEFVQSKKDDISDELFDAKKYFQKYMDSGDSVYVEMAKDELKHAGILIKKANSKLPSGEEKLKLKSYEDELKEIYEQMKD
mgnify:CR=1 FL=1